MLKINKAILWLVVTLMLLSVVSAAPPSPQFADTTVSHLDIVYPKTYHLAMNPSGFDLHFHVFNSTGHWLNASDVTCTIHIYNETNNHVLTNNLSGDSNGLDLAITLNSTLTNNVQEYSYIIFCNGYNGQTENGWLSTTFSVTPNGLPKEQYTTDFSLGAIILLPMLFAAFLIFGAFSLGEEHDILRVFLFMLGSLMVLLSFHFALLTTINVYGFTELQNTIGTTTYWLAWTLGAVVMYFIIYIIYKIFDGLGKRKEQELRY